MRTDPYMTTPDRVLCVVLMIHSNQLLESYNIHSVVYFEKTLYLLKIKLTASSLDDKVNFRHQKYK
jgi:hypothetical protein